MLHFKFSNLIYRVPGHEIVGEVVAVGTKAMAHFRVGERAGVGCMVDSCRACSYCAQGEEQYCKQVPIFTYNAKHRFAHCAEYNEDGGAITYGGYSQLILVDYRYTLHVPDNIPFQAAAPLLCAGITVYSPMKHYGLLPTQRFAVLGLGGLGHMAVKFGVAMGCDTTVISRGTSKKESALTELRANSYIDSTNEEEMKARTGTIDFLITTVCAPIDYTPYLNLLATDGKLIFVGVQAEPVALQSLGLIFQRKSVGGSLIGGIRETQEMLDFCAKNGIASDVEVIDASRINEAYDRTVRSDVKYRFVIDVSTL